LNSLWESFVLYTNFWIETNRCGVAGRPQAANRFSHAAAAAAAAATVEIVEKKRKERERERQSRYYNRLHS
jgi:hypothetical protein